MDGVNSQFMVRELTPLDYQVVNSFYFLYSYITDANDLGDAAPQTPRKKELPHSWLELSSSEYKGKNNVIPGCLRGA